MHHSYVNDVEVPENKKIICKICYLQDHTGTGDLDEDYHLGFTVGKGKAMYWMMIWHGSGNVTIYRCDTEGNDLRPRWISGDTKITIHFK